MASIPVSRTAGVQTALDSQAARAPWYFRRSPRSARPAVLSAHRNTSGHRNIDENSKNSKEWLRKPARELLIAMLTWSRLTPGRAGGALALIFFSVLLAPVIVRGQASLLLIATSASQPIQNHQADEDDLSRMRDVAMINRFRKGGLLVPVPVSTRYYYLHAIQTKYRYLRPWAKVFLTRLSRQHYAKFKRKLRVTSLVRTVAYQRALARRNGNAAAFKGPLRSSHLTGATLDISKRNLTRGSVAWLRRVLYSLRKSRYLYAIEEFQQPTFHVMVYRRYESYVESRKAAHQRELRVASDDTSDNG